MAKTVLVCVQGDTEEIAQSVETYLSANQSETLCSILTLPKDQVFGKPKLRAHAVEAIQDKCKDSDIRCIFIFLGNDDVVDKFWGQKNVCRSLEEIGKLEKFVTFIDCGISEDELLYWKETYDGKIGISLFKKQSELEETIRKKILEVVNNRPRGELSIPKAERKKESEIMEIFGTPPSHTHWAPEGISPRSTTSTTTSPGPIFSFSQDGGNSYPDAPSVPIEDRLQFDASPDEYPSVTAAGYVCMVGYHQFENDQLEARLTSGKDLSRMQGCFEKLGFEVNLRRQLTADETKEYFKSRVIQYENLDKGPEIIICVISSHGEENIDRKIHGPAIKEHHIFCKDGETVKTADIIRLFQTTKLKGITKIFLLQACSSVSELGYSTKEDRGTEVVVITDPNAEDRNKQSTNKDSFISQNKGGSMADAKGRRMQQVVPVPKISDTPVSSPTVDVPSIKLPVPSEELPPPPPPSVVIEEQCVMKINEDGKPEDVVYTPEVCLNDMMVVFASASGKYAYSHEKEGGWLFWALEETLNEKLKEQAKKIDLLDVLREVTCKFSLRNLEIKGEILKCVCCVHHRLRKDIVIQVPPQERRS